MGMFQLQTQPRMPAAPREYEVSYMNQLLNVLRLYFSQLDAVQNINMATLNLDLKTLPTDADIANLRLGDVFRDTVNNTQPQSQVLRVKTAL